MNKFVHMAGRELVVGRRVFGCVWLAESIIELQPDGKVAAKSSEWLAGSCEFPDTWKGGDSLILGCAGESRYTFYNSYFGPRTYVGGMYTRPEDVRLSRQLWIAPYRPVHRVHYLIATCYNYREKTLPTLLTSLADMGVPKSDVTVYCAQTPVGAHPCEFPGWNIIYGKYDAWEYAALIGMSQSDQLQDDTHYLLLHDTVVPGPDFYRLSQQVQDSLRADIIWAGMAVSQRTCNSWCNIGYFRGSWLRANSRRLSSLNKCTKEVGIDIELNRRKLGLMNWAELNSTATPFHTTEYTTGEQYLGRPRRRRYYPGLDLNKYWYPHYTRTATESARTL